MNETIITSQNRREVTFDGTLLKESVSSASLSEWDERTFAVKLFAVTGGGFVVVTEVRSSNAEIPEVIEAERVDTVQDVEAVLCMFDPIEHIKVHKICSRLGHAEAIRRANRVAMKAYCAVIDEITNFAHDFRAENPDCELVMKSEQKPKNLFWKLLGLG